MNGGRGAALLAAGAVAAPVVVGIGYAALGALDLVGVGAGTRPGLARIGRVLSEPAVLAGALWSVRVAAISTILATAGAMGVAIVFRGRGWADRLGRTLALLPLPIPHVVAGALGVLLLAQSGLLARVGFAVGVIESPATMPPLVYDRAGVGLVAALAWKELPFLALIAFSVLSGRVAVAEEAARTLGASRLQVARRVTFPLLWRGMLPGIVAVFAFAAGSYEAAALLAPSDPLALPLITMERYTDSSLERRGDAFVLTLLAVAIAAVAVAVHERVRTRWEALEW